MFGLVNNKKSFDFHPGLIDGLCLLQEYESMTMPHKTKETSNRENILIFLNIRLMVGGGGICIQVGYKICCYFFQISGGNPEIYIF